MSAIAGQRVEEGVGRRVIRLPGGTHHTSRRREQDEGIQIVGQFVQVDRRVDLRFADLVDQFRSERFDDAVGEHAGGMDHSRQRMRGRHLFEQGFQLTPVRHVTCDGLHLGTRGPQLRE